MNDFHLVVNQNNSLIRLSHYTTCARDFTIESHLLLFHHLSIQGSIIHYQKSENINMTNWMHEKCVINYSKGFSDEQLSTLLFVCSGLSCVCPLDSSVSPL